MDKPHILYDNYLFYKMPSRQLDMMINIQQKTMKRVRNTNYSKKGRRGLDFYLECLYFELHRRRFRQCLVDISKRLKPNTVQRTICFGNTEPEAEPRSEPELELEQEQGTAAANSASDLQSNLPPDDQTTEAAQGAVPKDPTRSKYSPRRLGFSLFRMLKMGGTKKPKKEKDIELNTVDVPQEGSAQSNSELGATVDGIEVVKPKIVLSPFTIRTVNYYDPQEGDEYFIRTLKA